MESVVGWETEVAIEKGLRALSPVPAIRQRQKAPAARWTAIKEAGTSTLLVGFARPIFGSRMFISVGR